MYDAINPIEGQQADSGRGLPISKLEEGMIASRLRGVARYLDKCNSTGCATTSEHYVGVKEVPLTYSCLTYVVLLPTLKPCPTYTSGVSVCIYDGGLGRLSLGGRNHSLQSEKSTQWREKRIV